MVRAQIGRESQKYGEFIKQTNEVQYLLALVILRQSTFVDDDYVDWLSEKAGLGTLINLYRASAKHSVSSFALFKQLKQYKKDRDRLAHKMFTPKKLTPTECETSIHLGDKILKTLYRSAKIPSKLRPKFR